MRSPTSPGATKQPNCCVGVASPLLEAPPPCICTTWMYHSSVAYASSRLKCRSVLHKTCLVDSSDWGVGLSGLLCGSQVPGFDTPGSTRRIRHFQSGVRLWGFETPGSICRLRHFQSGVMLWGFDTSGSICRLRHFQSGVTLWGFDTPGSTCRLRHFQSGVMLWGFDTPGSIRRDAARPR